MGPGFTYRVDNLDLINTVKHEFYSNPALICHNNSKQNYQRYLGTLDQYKITGSENSFWNDHQQLFEYLNTITYPRDPSYCINESWIKYYTAGDFSSLHAECGPWGGHCDQHSNVILLDQSPDLEGGIIVIAGDSFDVDIDNPYTKGNIRERLLTRILKTPGDAVTWTENVIHGLSKVDKGYRLVLVCTKIKYGDENQRGSGTAC